VSARFHIPGFGCLGAILEAAAEPE
jgi:hypothetical protein